MVDSWQKVSVATIQNCFAHCGLPVGQEASLLLPEATVTDEDASCLLEQEEFIRIDENMECFNEKEECYDTMKGSW